MYICVIVCIYVYTVCVYVYVDTHTQVGHIENWGGALKSTCITVTCVCFV